MTQGRSLIVGGGAFAVLVRNIAAVAQASAYTGCEQNRHE
jgi:hypothetical protein